MVLRGQTAEEIKFLAFSRNRLSPVTNIGTRPILFGTAFAMCGENRIGACSKLPVIAVIEMKGADQAGGAKMRNVNDGE